MNKHVETPTSELKQPQTSPEKPLSYTIVLTSNHKWAKLNTGVNAVQSVCGCNNLNHTQKEVKKFM